MKNKSNLIAFGILLVNIVIAYLVYDTIATDVRRGKEIARIDKLVIDKLEMIRKAQLAYLNMKGQFAPDWETLINTFQNEKYPKIKKIGDADLDSTVVVKIDTIFVDPIVEVFGMQYDMSKIKFVPPADTAVFIMKAGLVNKNDIMVPVFEVVDPYPVNPKRTLQVGSMLDANYTGNWR